MSKQQKPMTIDPYQQDQRIIFEPPADQTDAAEELFRIEQVAERTGLTKRALRYYEERGLLDPPTRTEGNYRLYTTADIDHIKRVKRIRELLGASLAEIKEMVDGEEARQAFRDEWARNPYPSARMHLLDRGEAVVKRQLEVVRARLADLLELENTLVFKQRRYQQRRDELQSQVGPPLATTNPEPSSDEQVGQ